MTENFPASNSTEKALEEALPKTYNSSDTECRWQRAWEKSDAFHSDPQASGQSFSVVIPPPNVTGSLHMGHAFNTALIDTVVRFQRLQGKNVLCLPGTDHASIAVQNILEKQLNNEGISRFDIGREAFLERAWEWKAESGGKIVDQLRRLGYSVDWKRQRFTLDEGLSDAVREAFVQLHEKGLIYRGEYLVNWCPVSGSAVSDLEVEMKEIDGFLWHFRYPLSNDYEVEGITHLEVATTRPETMLGDVAIAVNPSDKRYSNLIGKKVILPLLEREIPVIADDHVEPDFGTGCVKVTPAHDPNDFAIGQRHQLPLITVMNKDGTMNSNAGKFNGLDRFEARKAVVSALEERGLLTKVEPYRHNVPYSDRGKVPVEPLISTQWFVRMEPLASNCRECLERGEPNFVPSRWKKVYLDWLTDIRDWCISRQLWWGHRIPAWFVISETDGKVTNNTPYVVARTEEEAYLSAKTKFGDLVQIAQDEDVLDTWFSSGLWPFSTLGWPNESSIDFNCWYPTSTLITGFDIIFFWVARMTMMAGIFTGRMPFQNVYIHGLVRDEQNRKMSKSLGNGIDPLLLIDRYGTDALRFALVREVSGSGQDIRLDFDRKKKTSTTVESARNFANKLWNATRFALLHLDGETLETLGDFDVSSLQLSDRWILSRLAKVNHQTAYRYENFGLGEAAKGLYEFAWNDFCDWYLELIKRRLTPGDNPTKDLLNDQKNCKQILVRVLADLMVMLHPLMPHITEELWHAISGASEDKLLAKMSWPKYQKSFENDSLEESYTEIFEAIRVVRNLRAIAGLKPSDNIKVCFVTKKKSLAFDLEKAIDDIKALTKAKTLRVLDSSSLLETTNSTKILAGVTGELEVLLEIGDSVDLNSLKSRLEKDIFKANKEMQSLASRLENPNFLNKAPDDVVNECKKNLLEAQAQIKLAKQRLSDLF